MSKKWIDLSRDTRTDKQKIKTVTYTSGPVRKSTSLIVCEMRKWTSDTKKSPITKELTNHQPMQIYFIFSRAEIVLDEPI